jgi:hypothetical protein
MGMSRAELVAKVRRYAQDHYQDGGWDVIVECWTDGDICAAIGRARTLDGAVRKLRPAVAVLADRKPTPPIRRSERGHRDDPQGRPHWPDDRANVDGMSGGEYEEVSSEDAGRRVPQAAPRSEFDDYDASDKHQILGFITSLRPGDRVLVGQDGRTHEMYVDQRGVHRCDGPYGSWESTRVTVTFGPGRYCREVDVDAIHAGFVTLRRAV